ncbi:MAG: hypothetical protein VB035_06025 [Candidatus Fimivivens sp.]|nr:hypothetical protein [Candidatus Fimivivens sp.]
MKNGKWESKDVVGFVTAAVQAAKDQPAETMIEFECPVCGGKAIVSKAYSNGHHHSHCSDCGINFVE